MKAILITYIACFLTATCAGQAKNELSLNVGMSQLYRQDLIFSPFIHKDLSFLNFGLEFSREARYFQKASIRFGNFKPIITEPYDFTSDEKTVTTAPHNFNLIDIDYLFGRKIKQYNQAHLTAGALFAMDVQALNYWYGNSSYFGYYSAISLGAFGRYEYAIDKRSRITGTLQLPLFAWLARSPYLVNDDEFIENISSHSGFKTFFAYLGDGKLVTLNQWQELDLEVKYRYDINEKWKAGAAYLFEFIHSSEPRNLLSYRHSLNISGTFCF